MPKENLSDKLLHDRMKEIMDKKEEVDGEFSKREKVFKSFFPRLVSQ